MNSIKPGLILVGHGGLPSDCPQDLVMRLKRLEGQRRAQGKPMGDEEMDLDKTIREWPRTAKTDPYQAGLESLRDHLAGLFEKQPVQIAYNEFCAPTIHQAAQILIEKGINQITLVSTMFTPGGSHSEIEIPEEVDELRKQFSEVEFIYAWPFDLNKVAHLMANHVKNFKLECYQEN